MPKLINDVMVRISEADKKIIRHLGYYEASRAIGKTESYLRSIACKGSRFIRQTDLERIRERYRRS
jgi:hypothetical protein